MPESASRVFISIAEGRIEVEGSEAFVAEQLGQLRPILEGVAQQAVANRNKGQTGVHTESLQTPQPKPDLAGYENLFARADDKIQVLKDLPGNGNAQKAVAGALLLSLANTLNGEEVTTFDEIRDLCKTHGCLDSANFSKTVKAEKDAFIFGGSPRKKTVKLTVPGRKRAEALAAPLKG
jgi:hypothetical protein